MKLASPGSATVRVFFCCTGVGILNRGIESFFREAFDNIKDTSGIEARLVKGKAESGTRKAEIREKVIWCLPRTGCIAPLVGKLTGRSAYAVEQWSSFPGMVREIRRFQPHVVFTSEANLMFLLRRFRHQIRVPFRVLYSNGGPVRPPFNRHDCVHQVAPLYLAEALAAGEPAGKHFLVPYGIQVPEGAPVSDPAGRRAARERLGLPVERKLVLSVGWIARAHKRMDYVIEEVARMPEPRPFLQLLGAMDEASPEIVALGNRLLGPVNFSASSVPYGQVADFYRAADVFVLGSLKEGFGRVYLEALMHGLPTIGHCHPVIEYVLGDAGIVTDLSQPGNLAPVLSKALWNSLPLSSIFSHDPCSSTSVLARFRRESVRARFGWPILAPEYLKMFQAAARYPVA